MSRDTTRIVPAGEARRQARIEKGKDPDERSDMYRGRPTRPQPKPTDPPPARYVLAAPLSLADAASQLGVRPVQLAQAIPEGKVATVRGRGGELLMEDYQAELAPLVRGWLGERAWDGLTAWTDFWRAAADGENAGE